MSLQCLEDSQSEKKKNEKIRHQQWRIQGRGALLNFQTKLRPEGTKKNWGGPPPLSKGLDESHPSPPPPPLSQGLDPALTSKNQTTFFIPQHMIMWMPLFMDARHEIFILLVLQFSKDITLPPKISEVLSFRFQGRDKTFTWNFTLVLCRSFYLLHFSTTRKLWTLKASLQ